MNFLGNKDILNQYKIAFLCSKQVPAEIILKSYDWAIEQREKGVCVISSFHSKIEKDVIHYLLKGLQPIILVHARGMKKREDKILLNEVEKGRLLIISPFEETVTRISTNNAMRSIETIVEFADEVIIGYESPEGLISNVIKKCSKPIIYLQKGDYDFKTT